MRDPSYIIGHYIANLGQTLAKSTFK